MKNLTKENFGTGRSILTGVAVFLLMFMGCDNSTTPNQDLTSSYDTPVTMQSGDEINTTIDEQPIYMVPGFYFLAPMVKDAEYNGTFDAGLSPVVEICETTACATIHKSFDMDEDGSEGVRLDEDDEHYIVNWHTDQTGTEVGQTYRIRVSVAGTVLAHADIQMAENGRDAKNITDDEAIALVDGRTLPIKFRVEEGAVYVTDSGGGTITSEDRLVTLEIPENAIDGTIGITISSAMDELDDEDVIPGTLFDFGPSPFMFNEPVILTITFDPTNLPVGVSEDELRLLAVVDGEWVQLPGSSVDLSNLTVTGPIQSFSRKGVGRGKVSEITVTPADASLEVGGTQQFEATITNVDGEEMNRNVRWSSSDENVVTVDNNGLVTAVALGKSTIEARSGKVTGTADLTVEVAGPVVTTITVSPAEVTIAEGSTSQFTATVYDQNEEVMEDETVTWSSGDSGIASVDEAGFSTGVTEGETTIIATSGLVSGSANLVVLATSLDDSDWSRDTETAVVDLISPTGRVWMDRNLGAARAATSFSDSEAYGDLYQWGRAADDHQIRTSGTTTVLSLNNDTPGHGSFILAPNGPFDWRSPQSNNLWQGVNGINNPCPVGYRLPTEEEWIAESEYWGSGSYTKFGAYYSMKLPSAGLRSSNNGLLYNGGSSGFYWSSSTVDDTFARSVYFPGGGYLVNSTYRAEGRSVRCTKDWPFD